MACRVITCEQGSPEWHRARAGVITASMFSIARSRVGGLDERQQLYVNAMLSGKTEAEARLIAGYKAAPTSDTVRRALTGAKVGEPSQAALDYAFRLAVERISGEPLDEGFQIWQAKRGHELEPAARMEHEIQADVVVQRAGFIITEDGAFGVSADGLIGTDGGSEYKCFLAPEKLRAFHFDNDTSEVIDQVQGGMWITGRSYWHLGLYCPALAPAGKQLWWRRIERDDDYIEALEADLWQFKLLVDQFEGRLRLQAA